MKVTASQSGDTVIAAVSGRVDSVNATSFEQELSKAMEGGSSRLVVDCGELSYISSAGLRILLLAVKKTRAQGGGVALCQVQDHVREVLEVSGFTRIMTVRDTIDQALDSF